MFKVITSRPLWVNFLAGIGLLLILLLLFLGSLDLITHHGKTMRIPSVTGRTLADAKKILQAQGFEVQIQDSTYIDTTAPLQVIKQFPEADNQVKINRTVYLTINRSVAPIVDMPNLVSMTFRTAEVVRRQYGLKLGDTIFRPDFAKNSVLEQQFNGESIKPGTKIQQGSEITLVLGNGIGSEFVVPDLFGLTYREARTVLESNGLVLGAVVPDNDVNDSTVGYVYRQSPDRYDDSKNLNHIRQGQIVDVWLSAQRPARRLDSLQNAPTPATPNNY